MPPYLAISEGSLIKLHNVKDSFVCFALQSIINIFYEDKSNDS